MKHLFYIVLLGFWPWILWAQGAGVSNSGTVAAPFLTISLDPRGTAMGGAAAAYAGGIRCAVWNPAALASDEHSFFIAHSPWLAGITIDQAGLAFYLGSFGNLGAYLTSLNYGEMDVRTVTKPQGTGERFDATDFSLGLFYARNLTNRLKLGAGVKYVYQRIWHTTASTVALDIGTLFHSPIWQIDFGVNISNFGGDMRLSGRDLRVFHDIDPVMTGNNDRIPAQLETDAWPLPLLLRTGLQRTFRLTPFHSIITAIDAYFPQDNYGSLNAGIEYGFRKIFFVRAGYRGLFLKDNQGGLSAGAGFALRSGSLRWTVDFAYSDYGVLQQITIFALSVNWQ